MYYGALLIPTQLKIEPKLDLFTAKESEINIVFFQTKF